MKVYPFALVFFVIGNIFAQEIITESVKMTDFEDSSVYLNVLNSVARAVNDQNIDAYSKCFFNFSKNDRRRLAIFFAEHDPSSEIIEHHIVYENKNEIELVVKYKVVYDEANISIVQSIVYMKNQDFSWKIVREKIIKKSSLNNTKSCSNGNCKTIDNCFNGKCRINVGS